MIENDESGLLPGVSVLTTTYNRADVLGRAIDSVLAQDTPCWELVVIDNGSTDATQELLATYSDPRIRVVNVDVNCGCTGGRNIGLDHISREWFTFLDSDDELLPQALSTLLAVPGRIDQSIDAVECNCFDSQAGTFTGRGLDHDQWLDHQKRLRRCSGEFWGITKTSLLNGSRFNAKIQHEALLWFKIDRKARRYYIHQGLRIYHTERTDTESFRQRTDLASRYPECIALVNEEMEYLRGYAELAPDRYSALLFHIFRVFLVSGDRRRAWAVYRELCRRGSKQQRVAARFALALGPRSIDAAQYVRDTVRQHQTKAARPKHSSEKA